MQTTPSGTGNTRSSVCIALGIAAVDVESSAKPIGTMRIGSAFDFWATGFVIADLDPLSVVKVCVTGLFASLIWGLGRDADSWLPLIWVALFFITGKIYIVRARRAE